MYIVQGRGVYQSVELGCLGVVPRRGSRNTLCHIALPSGNRLPGFRMVSAARGWRYNRILPILLIPIKGLQGRLCKPFFLFDKYICQEVEPLDEDLCGTRRVDLERQIFYKEKKMGRPVNKDKIGYGAGRIAVTRHFFTGASEATTAAHIIRQVSDNRFVVRLDSNAGDDSADEILQLTNLGSGNLTEGTFEIDAYGTDSTTYQVTKIRNRTVQLEAGGTEFNAVYGIGNIPEALETGTNPANTLAVALPAQ